MGWGQLGADVWNTVKAGGGSIAKAGMWGAGLGVAAGGAGWVASQFAPEYIQSQGPFQSAMTGGMWGLGAAAAIKTLGATKGFDGMKYGLSNLSRFSGSKTAWGIGIGAGVMGMKSIINTSFTRPAN